MRCCNVLQCVASLLISEGEIGVKSFWLRDKGRERERKRGRKWDGKKEKEEGMVERKEEGTVEGKEGDREQGRVEGMVEK